MAPVLRPRDARRYRQLQRMPVRRPHRVPAGHRARHPGRHEPALTGEVRERRGPRRAHHRRQLDHHQEGLQGRCQGHLPPRIRDRGEGRHQGRRQHGHPGQAVQGDRVLHPGEPGQGPSEDHPRQEDGPARQEQALHQAGHREPIPNPGGHPPASILIVLS